MVKEQTNILRRVAISGLRRSIVALLLLLICAFPLLEARIHPTEVMQQGPCKPADQSFISQTDFFVAPASPEIAPKLERVWSSSFAQVLPDVHLTKLPRQINEEGNRPTLVPPRLLLISIESSSER